MIGAFLLGLAGSWHCAGMCGGFVWGQRPLVYLLGRLLGYCLVGLGLGLGGTWALQWLGSRLLLAVSGCLLVAMGLARGQVVKPRNGFSLGAFLWQELSPWLRRPGSQARFLLGLATALFPCGLLYAAWLQAANQPGVLGAVGCMAAFWVGTLPGLLAPRWIARWLGQGRGIEQVALMLTGSIMLAQALWPDLPGTPTGHCLMP